MGSSCRQVCAGQVLGRTPESTSLGEVSRCASRTLERVLRWVARRGATARRAAESARFRARQLSGRVLVLLASRGHRIRPAGLAIGPRDCHAGLMTETPTSHAPVETGY